MSEYDFDQATSPFLASKSDDGFLWLGSHHGDGAVIIAMVAVHVMQVTVHQIVHMIAVRNGFVTTAGSMCMTRIVATALVRRRACIRVGLGDGDGVLIRMVLVRVMQVPIVQVIGVPVVLDGLMTASRSVDVVVRIMDLAIGHGEFLSGLI